MPKQAFALEAGGPKRLEVAWKGIWKEITVSLDGTVLGAIADQKALTAGQTFTLPDGATLKVQLVSKFMVTELQVARNGQPVPGSASDPETRLKNAYIVIYFLAGFNLVLGLVAVIFNIEFLQRIGVGWGSAVFGLILATLGFLTQRKSLIALILAIVLLALDGLLGIAAAVAAGQSSSMVSGIFVRILFLVILAQGVPALRALQAQGKQAGAPTIMEQ